MVNENQEPEYHNNNILNVLAGLLIGGLVGAIAMLLLAPQSGKDTRMQVQERGIELRDRATGIMDNTLARVRLDGKRITMDGRQKAKELLQRGQELAVEQLERVSDAAQAGKKAIQST